MEALLAVVIGTLASTGTYLLLRARSFAVILGLTLLSYAVNLFIFVMGRVAIDAVPVIRAGAPTAVGPYADPLPQALVLTAIVISFALTAVVLVIALHANAAAGTDHVDGREP
jgi:multicomponent K+:H+ antiporter subunit C